uniref:Uncharacterized protein n=1 Tax=Anguilla anguilla TaxID=7936 RepID=A0A0E9RP96_ANGAN
MMPPIGCKLVLTFVPYISCTWKNSLRLMLFYSLLKEKSIVSIYVSPAGKV